MLLKRKVYLSLILAVVAPLAISTLIFSNSIRSNTEDKLAKVDLPTALSEVKSQIELELSTPIVVGKEIAQNLFVQQWMNNNEDAQSRGKFIDYLKHIKNKNQASNAYIISKNSRNYYTDEGISRQIDSSDTWFDAFLASDRPFEVALDIDKGSSEVMVFINYAIEDKINNRWVIAEGFAFAPSVQKRNYMFELESMIRSIEIK